ncbi:ABC transporter ATP-binding protein [Clostridium sp.]|uniref:ABC transporter ATP-binding protein n=1 Tax=Clostridium sp. TaxID=1506 RepID=UPI002FC60307
MEIIKIENLTKKYGEGDNEVVALNSVNLTVNAGEFVAIIGPSGSGKSTLLHMLGGVDNPTSGSVNINGVNISKLNDEKLSQFRRRNIGLIFQFFNLIPVMSAKENIELPYIIDERKPDIDYINELIELLDLKGRENHMPSQLSGGQEQRVAIGRALAYKPTIILADEPTGNLDSKNTKEIMKLLKHCSRKYNQTLIIITHDLNIAAEADRVVRIEDGNLSDERGN